MLVRVLIAFTFAGLIGGFQNCGRSGLSPDSPSAKGEKVIGSTSSYDKIKYAPQMEMGLQFADAYAQLNIDLQAGSLELTPAGSSSAKDCAVDGPRLALLRDLMASSQVCEPSPTAGVAVCMAIGLSDIELSNAAQSLQLRPNICENGVLLCGGNDERLRTILNDIRDNPPSACAP